MTIAATPSVHILLVAASLGGNGMPGGGKAICVQADAMKAALF